MIFWIFLFVLVVGIAVSFIAEKCDVKYYSYVKTAGYILTAIGAVVSAIMMFALFVGHLGADGNVALNQLRYDMLVYQYENDIYENDNDLGKRELMVDIQEWNEDLAFYQAVQDDFWIGIFYPNVYDQFEFIELKEPISDVQN